MEDFRFEKGNVTATLFKSSEIVLEDPEASPITQAFKTFEFMLDMASNYLVGIVSLTSMVFIAF